MKILLEIMIAITILILFIWYLAKAIEKQQEIQDVMLCESALKSGNVEYLIKCNQ